MDNIELNKTTVNELIYSVRNLFNVNMEVIAKDSLVLEAYFKHALDRCKIGSFCIYDGSDNCGEFVLESTIRQYDVNLHTYRDGSRTIIIKVVINE